VKPLGKAAQAKWRLATYETEVMNPILAMIRARDEPDEYPLDDVLVDALYAVHDELRRVAVEFGASWAK
jgi:hypothetical protein